MNRFGDNLSIELFGESHTPLLGVVIRGVPAQLQFTAEDFLSDIARRKSGRRGTTPRIESDTPIIEDRRMTDGSIVISFENNNTKPSDYDRFKTVPRPGHADFTSTVKYGEPSSGGGIFSGRMTLPIVAAGVLAKKIISPVSVRAALVEVGGVPFCNEEAVSSALMQAAEEGDSLGGVIECTCDNVPAGLGEPFFNSVESLISHAVYAIPGIRGIEFGDGFKAAEMKGSQHNDPFIDAEGHTSRNGAGGINGGITNGNQIRFRVAVKPTSTIRKAQETFDFKAGEMTTLSAGGRHDVCFALRVPPVIEAVTAIVLANLFLTKKQTI